jgi:hypothetical protein
MRSFKIFFSSPVVINMMKSSRMRWTGQVALIGEKISRNNSLLEKFEGKGLLEHIRERMFDYVDCIQLV